MHQSLIFSPERSLQLTLKMQQAFAILQMSQQELAEFLYEEIEKNPLLEEVRPAPSSRDIPEIASPYSFQDVLSSQIREHFHTIEDQKIAELLMGYLDEKGFLGAPLPQIAQDHGLSLESVEKVLEVLQTFDPPGLFARDLQESLLLQLKRHGRANTDAFFLIEHHFQDFLKGRYLRIQKAKKSLDLAEAIHVLAQLSLRPIEKFRSEIVSPIVVDVVIEEVEEKGWSVRLVGDFLPTFHMHTKYDALRVVSKEERKTLQFWRSQGKWLLYALQKRKELLLAISIYITARQQEFLGLRGPLKVLTLAEIAKHLSLHPSTISRALREKYAETPRGILLLKTLVTSSPEAIEIKTQIQKIIENEDKHNPLTDEEVAEQLNGIQGGIARRTMAKYRKELNIPIARKRVRKFKQSPS